MKTYKTNAFGKTSLNINTSREGERLETKIERAMTNKEPMGLEKTQIIFQPRAEGVNAQYNPRTDRFEVAVEAMGQVQKSLATKRSERAANRNKPTPTTDKQPEGQNDPGTGK